MPANLSLLLNFIFLVAVVVAISRLVISRRQNLTQDYKQPSLGGGDARSVDEIIAVRKLVNEENSNDGPSFFDAQEYATQTDAQQDVNGQSRYARTEDAEEAAISYKTDKEESRNTFENRAPNINTKTIDSQRATKKSAEGFAPVDNMLVMFLLAKEQRQFVGYELLQTVLASGLRFGEGYLFHRHQLPNGQGPIMFSLAAATSSGIFDLQNIGAFSTRGLCLFMQISGNAAIDLERFNILYETARQLSDGLDAHLLDAQRQPLTQEGLARYQQLLGATSNCETA